jgi:hypothetical protein
MLPENITNSLGLLESSEGPATFAYAYVLAGTALGAGITWLLMSKAGALLKETLVQYLRPDKNRQYAERLREEGGLPGPIKHLAP